MGMLHSMDVQVCSSFYVQGSPPAHLLEAAMREYEEVVGLKHPSVKACFRCAEQLLSNLPEDQREKVDS